MQRVRGGVLGLIVVALAGAEAIVAAEAPSALRFPEFLEQYAATYRFSLGRPAGMQITADGSAVLFLRSEPRSFERNLFEFDTKSGRERVLATAQQLLAGQAELLSDEERARRERLRLAARGIAGFELSQDGMHVLIPLSDRLFLLERATGTSRELPIGAGGAIDAQLSPDAKRVAFVRGGDVYVLDIDANVPRQVTSGATETLTHGLAEFVAQEEMARMHGYWWAPDSRSLLVQETDTSDVELLSIADPAHPERPTQTWRYPRPGKHNARVRLGIVAATGSDIGWIAWDAVKYPYLAAAAWNENAPPTIVVQNRTQTEEVVLSVDPVTRGVKELLREKDAAWINLDAGMPQWLPSGQAFLWSSERTGQWQLELHGQDGRLLSTLTTDAQNYRRVCGIDEAGHTAIIAGGSNPTETHLFRIAWDETNLAAGPRGAIEQLTSAAGVHSATIAEKSGSYVLTTQTLTADPQVSIHERGGRAVGTLRSVAEASPLPARVELVELASTPPLHAAIVRPRDFQQGQRYPVIVSVYGGPHSQMVVAARGRYQLDQWLAEQGFVVVSIDGRGTPARGREWERAIKGNLIDVPLADQVAGLKALGKKFPELDLSRVGIYGWSFGGYFSAMAVAQQPAVFHAGVAGAPVTDWLDYDTHYTERYLGLPAENEAGYRGSSVLNFANQLERPLLVIHGTADDNVYFLHSVRLADALFRARRDFDFLPLSGLTHMVPDPVVTRSLYTRIAEYFLTHVRDKR